MAARLGPTGWARWAWRQLTSMRTALFLLMLLAVAAVPGSIFPQRSIDAGRVADYLVSHPTIGPWLDRLSFFDVFSSPWFSAIYLLLVISLLGCIIPRMRTHVSALRSAPPRAPARLDRLAAYAQVEVDTDVETALAAAEAVLKKRRFRVARHDAGSVSAENGYLRESGNLLFHVGLCAIIVGVAVGHLFGWRGDIIVPVGSGFSSTVTSYDTMNPGPLVNTSELPPFQLTLDALTVTFNQQAGGQLGVPKQFSASITTVDKPGDAPIKQPLDLNAPVGIDGANVYLLGNGYAPVITVRDANGNVLYQEATPFLPQDNSYRSVGTVKVTSAVPEQLGLSGLFLPTADPRSGAEPVSIFPGPDNPELILAVYRGTLFPGGLPQSVYTLNTSQMSAVPGANGKPLVLRLTPGQRVTLPDGLGSVSFDKVVRWGGLSVRHDPGKQVTFGAAVLTILALLATLLVRRRRLFVRAQELPAQAADGGAGAETDWSGSAGRRTVIRIGGISRTTDPALNALVASICDELIERNRPA